MSLYTISGVPDAHTVTLGDGELVSFSGETLSLYISAPAGTKVYFSNPDFVADEKYLTLPESGSVQLFARVSGVIIKGSGTAEVIGFVPGR